MKKLIALLLGGILSLSVMADHNDYGKRYGWQ